MIDYEPILLDSNSEIEQILKKYHTCTFRKGYARFGPDKCFLPIRYKDFSEEILNMDIYPDDIWLISHPKTGTTWCQEMAWCLANNLDYKAAEVVLPIRFPFLDLSIIFDYRDFSEEHHDLKLNLDMLNSVENIKQLKRPRFIKTHLPWALLPKQLTNGLVKPKIIYVCRNGKDTCVSYYHHSRLLEGFTGDFQQFFKLFINDAVIFNPFWEHILDFWKRRNQENILFLKYEDMKLNLLNEVMKVANFLNKSYSSEEFKILCKHLSFQNMKNNPSVNYEEAVEFNKRFNLINEDGNFIRSGTIGNYKTLMSPEMINEFDEWSKKKLQGTGLNYY